MKYPPILFFALLMSGCAVNQKPSNEALTSDVSTTNGQVTDAALSVITTSWSSLTENSVERILLALVSFALVAAVIALIKRRKAVVESNVQPKQADSGSTASLTEAVATLARDLSIREKETQKLHEIIVRKEQRRVLSRVCSIYETAEFTRRINAASKIDDKEALNQLLMEIESALADLSLEILDISVGAFVKDLLPGSFTIVSAEVSDTPSSAGKVKEIVSHAIYVKDGSGCLLFISPAKLKVYKL